VRWRSDGPWAEATTRDIGVGGAFLCEVALPIDTAITLALPVAGRADALTLDAVVRWASPDGIGVQFLDVDIDVLLALNALLADHADAR
jgi:hypothetical protein